MFKGRKSNILYWESAVTGDAQGLSRQCLSTNLKQNLGPWQSQCQGVHRIFSRVRKEAAAVSDR